MDKAPCNRLQSLAIGDHHVFAPRAGDVVLVHIAPNLDLGAFLLSITLFVNVGPINGHLERTMQSSRVRRLMMRWIEGEKAAGIPSAQALAQRSKYSYLSLPELPWTRERSLRLRITRSAGMRRTSTT